MDVSVVKYLIGLASSEPHTSDSPRRSLTIDTRAAVAKHLDSHKETSEETTALMKLVSVLDCEVDRIIEISSRSHAGDPAWSRISEAATRCLERLGFQKEEWWNYLGEYWVELVILVACGEGYLLFRVLEDGEKQELSPQLLPTLIAYLEGHQASQVRSVAAVALAECNLGAGALPALTVGLTDPSAKVRQACMRSLTGLGLQAPTAIPSLIKMTSAEDWGERKDAAAALGAVGLGDSSALEALAGLLIDSNWRVRSIAIQSLGVASGIDAAVEAAVINSLEDKDEMVRKHAVKAVATLKLCSEPAIERLLRCLVDPHQAVRTWTADALGGLGVTDLAIVSALESAAATDESGSVRERAATAAAALLKTVP